VAEVGEQELRRSDLKPKAIVDRSGAGLALRRPPTKVRRHIAVIEREHFDS
jgi:hypothetical protein